MEEVIDRVGRGLVDAIVAVMLAGALIFLWHWFRGGYKHVAGILEERKLSRKRIKTKRKEEAQNMSDGVTTLMQGMKAAGVLTEEGERQWIQKFKSIGLKDVGRETSTGAYWYEPVVHGLYAMRNRLLSRKPKEDTTTRVYLD